MKLKYCLIGDDKGKPVADSKPDDLSLSGLYLWSKAFKQFGADGDILNIWRKEDLENFDIVHINYTPSNIKLIEVIKKELKDSSVKIVANVDLDMKYWGQNWAYYIHQMESELKHADNVFHVEPIGAMLLTDIIGIQVTTLPHPVDVSTLYDHIRIEREPIIGTIYHRYFPDTLTPYIAQKELPYRRILFGYTPIAKTPMVANAGMYDQILPYTNFKNHISEVSKCAIGCDLYSGFTYGRAVVEFAALGIPVVVSNTIHASYKLFPKSTVNAWNIADIKSKLFELHNNQEFAEESIKYAHENCKEYSLKQSYNKFIKMLEL